MEEDFHEIFFAVNFAQKYMYAFLPRTKVIHFGARLAHLMIKRIESQWIRDHPEHESARRVLHLSETPDKVVVESCDDVALTVAEVVNCFPAGFTMYVNPGSVTFTDNTTNGQVTLLDERFQTGWENIAPVECNKLTTVKSVHNAHISAVANCSDGINGTVNQPTRPDDRTYTALEFAMTRFGTTKLRMFGVDKNTLSAACSMY